MRCWVTFKEQQLNTQRGNRGMRFTEYVSREEVDVVIVRWSRATNARLLSTTGGEVKTVSGLRAACYERAR